MNLIIGSPFLDEIFRYGIIPNILLTIIFVLGIHAFSRTKYAINIAPCLAIPTFISIWSSHLLRDIDLLVIGESFGALFCGLIILLLVQFVFMQEAVTGRIYLMDIVAWLVGMHVSRRST